MIAGGSSRLAPTSTHVFTGATGFVGSNFLWRVAKGGCQSFALARADSEASALARVREALERAARANGARGLASESPVRAFAADVVAESCGLSADALRSLKRAQPAIFWHFAASLRYEERHRSEIFRSNLDGTRRALELARSLGSSWFLYVSTAYTAGCASGSVREALHGVDRAFNNCYEESKAHAEHAVADFCAEHGLRYAILRPSIIVGPFSTKSTGGSTSGLYGFARELFRVSGALRALGRRAEIRGEPRTPCNLMPIDWFVDDVLALLESGLASGGVYHHTSERALDIECVGNAVARVFELPGFAIRPQQRAARSELEELLEKRTGFYASYLTNGKLFERARPFPRELTQQDLEEYLAECVSDATSEPAAASYDERQRQKRAR